VTINYELVKCCTDNFLQRLLILKGPAGSGKTTTISLLSKAMTFDTSEWRSPTVADTGINSFSSQFDDFLNRGRAFGKLDLFSCMPHAEISGTAMQKEAGNRILLVEEFPSTMTLSSSALASFRNVLLQYLAAAVPPRSAIFEQSKAYLNTYPPIVLIISESLLTSATASTDSFTAHRLLGPDLCNHPYATILEFNPIAPTLITKALELAIKKEARVSKRRRIPGPAVLKRLSELGDVRSAVNGLEFLCLRGDADSDWGGRTAAKTKRSNKTSSSLTNMEKESLELVTQREATLGIFHAVGKVVWNKREEPRITDPQEEPLSKPPDHMAAFSRPMVPQVETDELLNEIGTDIQTFTAALHENYVLSTNGPSFINSASSCIDFLSESDLLSPSSRQMTRSSRLNPGFGGGALMQAGGVDMLRQNEICFHVAVRGLQFSLPSPVCRAPHPNGRRGDSFKMFYPVSLKIWKPSEGIHDLISLEMRRLLAPDLGGGRGSVLGVSGAGRRGEGVESWRSRNLSSFLPTIDHNVLGHHESRRVWATRDELLLERLPYQAKLRPGATRAIQKVTQLSGVVLTSDGEVDGDISEAAVVDLSAADETTDRNESPQKRFGLRQDSLVGNAADLDASREVAAATEKLYISEDDIEDE
jgi:cell cycle checkpoint protein